jgi:EAL domain-containing protein (putative c-di-GMP-specific phosphodiesterase class I)
VQLPRLAELRRALTTGELVLHWQPVVDARRALHHVEGLVRWQHPERGLLGADEVVPLAEQGGLAGELTTVVLDLALRRAAGWRTDGRPVDVAVNVPASVVGRPGWTDAVLTALTTHGLTPDDLLLEVTESSLATQGARQGLAELAAAGIRLALDDFGTGWSSLAHLRQLPVRQVKIDRSFVTGADGDPADRALVRAITTLGHELGLQVVAEGVETPGVERLLHTLGVDLQQGWLHGRPGPDLTEPEDQSR